MTTTANIRFLLDGQIHTVDFSARGIPPTTTVLNYLRMLPGHKGVKEGCAEGDCGACTVVLAEVENNGNLRYFSVDSCLVFLPMLHGRQLITIENLANQGVLHPAQQAMIDTDGSQCGYCTPGIVMSLFALFHNHKSPQHNTITNALTGNLCRCTGYRPIIDAAREMYHIRKNDQFDDQENETIALLREINREKTAIQIVSHDQVYLKPLKLEEALQFRQQHPDALVVAGSTDVALLQTKKRIHLDKILDISAVDELNFIVEDHNTLAVGANTSLEELHRYTEAQMPYIHDILKVFGSLQIRNMATLGGNVGTASPIGDTLPVLLVLQSNILLLKAGGKRQMPIEDFIVDYRKTALQADELIAMVSFEKPAHNEIIKSYKISKRKDLDISSVSGCFRLLLDDDNHVKKISMAFGGVAAMPKRATEAEAFLGGKPWNESTVKAAGKILYNSFTPLTDARSGAEARKIMTRNLLIKFWSETMHFKAKQQNHPS